MKATELMVNDWINSDFDIFQIKEIFEDAVRDNGGNDYEFDCISPILLTGDILKSNGFELVEIGDNGPSTPKTNVNRYEKWECKTMFQTFYLSYDRHAKNCSLNAFGNHISQIIYVHELQNAMRVCGVEKEVEACQQ